MFFSFLLIALFSTSLLHVEGLSSRVLVIGGTGRVGRNIVPKLLKKGFDVRVLVRNKESAFYLKELKGAKLFEGDVTIMDCLLTASEGCETVISVHGVKPPRYSRITDLFIHPKRLGNHPYNVNYLGVQKILAAMEMNKCKKLIRITAVSVDKSAFYPFRVLFNLLLSFTAKWHEASEIAIRRSGIDYTVIRPTGIQEIPSASMNPRRSLILLPGDSPVKPPLPGRIPVEDIGELVIKSIDNLSKTTVVCSSIEQQPSSSGSSSSTGSGSGTSENSVEVSGPKTWDSLIATMPKDHRTFKLRPHKLAATVYIALLSVISTLLVKMLLFLGHKAVKLVLK